MKNVYRFFWRSSPGNSTRSIWAYADSEDAARQSVVARLKSNLEDGGELLEHVTCFDDPYSAECQCPAGCGVSDMLPQTEKDEYQRDRVKVEADSEYENKLATLERTRTKKIQTGVDIAMSRPVQGVSFNSHTHTA